jgi:cardiolipin synthase
MIHAKTAVADGKVSLVGSSNLDPLSMRLNFELNLAVVDAGTGQEMQRMFERDLSEARPVIPTAWNRRPLWQKAAERAAALVGARL